MAKADPIHPAGSKLTLVLNGATYTVSTMPFFVREDPHIQIWEYKQPSASFPYYQFNFARPMAQPTCSRATLPFQSANPLPPAGEPPAVYPLEKEQHV